MREIALALRRLHFKPKEQSVFEGNAAKGRYSFVPSEKEKHVVAWNEHGVVLWASSQAPPGSVVRQAAPRVRGGPPPTGPTAPSEPFGSAPEELRKLVDETALWEHAPKEKTEWRWAYPAGQDRATITDAAQGFDSALRRYGKYYDNDTRPNTDNWPREIYKLHRNLGQAIERIARAALDGGSDITADDDHAFRQEQAGSKGLQPKELPRAVEMLAALGIRWSV